MSVESIINWLSDQENYTDYIIGKFVPKNKVDLSTSPIIREDIRFKDMVIEYAFDIPLPGNKHITLDIDKNVIAAFDLTRNQLYNCALRNAVRTYFCMPLDDVLKAAYPEMEIKSTPAYVLSSYNNYYGAFAMCSNDILMNVCREGFDAKDDLVILPCGKHEVMVLPKWEFPISELKELVHECNRTEVVGDDCITDHVYIWDRCTETLTEI